jgi:hypothetical protein
LGEAERFAAVIAIGENMEVAFGERRVSHHATLDDGDVATSMSGLIKMGGIVSVGTDGCQFGGSNIFGVGVDAQGFARGFFGVKVASRMTVLRVIRDTDATVVTAGCFAFERESHE